MTVGEITGGRERQSPRGREPDGPSLGLGVWQVARRGCGGCMCGTPCDGTLEHGISTYRKPAQVTQTRIASGQALSDSGGTRTGVTFTTKFIRHIRIRSRDGAELEGG